MSARRAARLRDAALALTGAMLAFPGLAAGATFWTGPPLHFAKASFADPLLPANQDRITPTTWLTRGSNQGLFNAALEAEYLLNVSPVNTEWAPGSIDDGVGNLTFSDWRTAVGAHPPTALDEPFVLHILDDDIYIDVTFLTWDVGGTSGPGGAFSYARSTPSVETVPALERSGVTLLALCAAARVSRRR